MNHFTNKFCCPVRFTSKYSSTVRTRLIVKPPSRSQEHLFFSNSTRFRATVRLTTTETASGAFVVGNQSGDNFRHLR